MNSYFGNSPFSMFKKKIHRDSHSFSTGRPYFGLESTSSSSKRELFGVKRRSDPWQYDPYESPSKIVKIDDHSSDEEAYQYRKKTSKPRVETVTSANAMDTETQAIGDYSSDEHVIEDSSQEKGTPSKCKEITEYTTPQKGNAGEESESPIKTPVLKRNRPDAEMEISQYESPNRAATIKTEAEERKTPTRSQIITEDVIEELANMQEGPCIHREKKWYAKSAYEIDDSVNLSLIVLRSVTMDDADGKLEGPLVWTLCFDTTFDCERFVIFIEKSVRKIKRGVCVRMFPPWLAITLPKLGDEVIHSADHFQVIIPSLLNISIEKIRCVMSSSSISHKKFINSIPGKTGSQVLEHIPQLRYYNHTVRKQTTFFKVNAIIDAMVWLNFVSPEAYQVLVKDCDMVFSVIHISRNIFDGEIPLNKFMRFSNVVCGTQVSDQTYTPMFSILRSLGSQQTNFYKFVWKPESELVDLDDSPVPQPVICTYRLTLNDLQRTFLEDSRVSTNGKILSLGKSELILGDDNGSRVRMLLLSSFNQNGLLKPADIGREIVIKFLRVSNDTIYTLDQYTNVLFVK